jgi:hypothetical protein
MNDIATGASDSLQEQIARVERMQEDTRRFCAEQHRLSGRDLPGWLLVITGITIGAALEGGLLALFKCLGL